MKKYVIPNKQINERFTYDKIWGRYCLRLSQRVFFTPEQLKDSLLNKRELTAKALLRFAKMAKKLAYETMECKK